MPTEPIAVSAEEGYAQIIRGLISYHERFALCQGAGPSRTEQCKDIYTSALRYALELIERELEKSGTEQA